MDKKHLVKYLHCLLADTRVLTIKSQMYHWNVKSYNFLTMHELFQKIYEDFFFFQDIIAETIRTLGVFVCFERINMDSSSLRTDNMNELNCKEMICNLIEDLKIYEKGLKETIKLAQNMEEEGISNDLSEMLSKIQKYRWFLKSHLSQHDS